MPPVPPDQCAFTLTRPDGLAVPFVTYTMHPPDRVCLAGCWLQGGRRWLLDLQLPAEQTALAAELLWPLWATLQLGD